MTDSRPGTRHPRQPGRHEAAQRRRPPRTPLGRPAAGVRGVGPDGGEPAPTSRDAPSPSTAATLMTRRQRRRRRDRRRRWFDLAVLASLAALLLLVVAHLPDGKLDRLDDRAAASGPTADASTPPSGVQPAGNVGEIARPGEVIRIGVEAAAMVVPTAGSGRVRLLPIPGRDSRATGRTIRYTVAIEGGLRVRIDDLPATVRSILVAPRGWESVEDVHFVAVSPRQAAAGVRPDVQVVLASPALVDRLCHPLQTHGEVSCFNDGRVVLNARRWWAGATTYGGDLAGYRTYLVNHEVGHALGRGHVTCPGPGRPAPVMLQQTIGLGGCRPYPNPR